jgi:hypothetical protein
VKDEIIEVGLAWDNPVTGDYREVTYSLPFEPENASPRALEVNGWGKRPFPPQNTESYSADFLAEVLADRHIVGKNPWFDAGFLEAHLAEFDLRPDWHHRHVDVGCLAWGWFNAHNKGRQVLQSPNVETVGEMLGISRETSPGDGEFHTALDDARWAHKVFRAIVPRA